MTVAASPTSVPLPACLLAVARGHDGLGVGITATRLVPRGAVLLHAEGVIVRTPSRYSLQIGERSHLDVPPGVDPDAVDDPLYWRYLNHSCSPNATFQGVDLIALRPIAAGESITFDYNTTEFEMAEPFTCQCGACGGLVVAGFGRLPWPERVLLAPSASAHVMRLGLASVDVPARSCA